MDVFAIDCYQGLNNITLETCDSKLWHDWVANMAGHEATATRYLTFVLGFYVGTMIKRWWEQVRTRPTIDPIINAVVGFVKCKEKGQEEKALKMRKVNNQITF